ncbi:DAK2 domain-containing protein [Nocardioides speluncae]|uniref:DAK2 domain-containing protein n=1 Tax=Nocardioides speluncae TaxID=2670337 RepID=UPI000D68CE7C|nr:DAK2 domain-containing protein [Nocardioides speluncae]
MTVEKGSTVLPAVLRFVDVACDALAEAREEIDALNVFPVPDGDTGTNMFLTMTAARDALQAAVDPDAEEPAVLAALARGALLGARGNSGVILAQMVSAVCRRLSRVPEGERAAVTIAESIREATDASYAAVGVPVEGTILTVSRAASNAALAVAEDPASQTADVYAAAAAAAREALARTPEQLQTLADAGVVDAGGRGLSVVFDAAETALTGRRRVAPPSVLGSRRIPMPMPTGDLTAEGPAYEVMYLLDADDDAVPALRGRLLPLGDSLVIVGGDGLWNVHVHVDDVGAAIEAGIEAGRPYRVRVTHFAEQTQAARERRSRVAGRRVVAVTAGPGLADLFESAGAVVVSGGPGRRPSAGMLLVAITECGAAEVVVLPNDPDSVRAAEIAARTAEEESEVRVAVIPSQAQVQGLAAVAVHEPGRTFDADVLEMTATARHARHGAVTIAAKKAITMGGPCEPGDVLGVIAGDFAIVGEDLYDVGVEVIQRLIGGGGELVTIVAGAEDRPANGERLADRWAAYVEEQHPTVDVVVYDGGQERYPLLVGVE